MDSLGRFLAESSTAARIHLTPVVIVNRFTVSPAQVTSMSEGGRLSPVDGEVCELEVGGTVIARGRIVRRWWRRSYFKVGEMAKGEKQ